MCVYTIPTGKDTLDSPRDQTGTTNKGMLVLPRMAVQTPQRAGDSFSSLPDGAVVYTQHRKSMSMWAEKIALEIVPYKIPWYPWIVDTMV